MQEKFTPEAVASSTPTPLEREEELLRKFNEASIAYYLLADRPERLDRLEQVGELMDRLGTELRSGSL